MKTAITERFKQVKQTFLAWPRWRQALAVLGLLLTLNLLFGGAGESPKDEGYRGVRLVVSDVEAEPHHRQIVIYGSTRPVRDVDLNAQSQGEVVDVPAQEGTRLNKGDVILTIDPRERPERLAEVKAVVRQREIEFEAARKLQKRGFQSEISLAQAKAQLERARAELKRTQLDFDFTQLKAPFNGLLEMVNAEEGDFVGIGTFGVEGPAARMVDLDPLLVVAQLAEQDYGEVAIGDEATARMGNGFLVEGIVSYVGYVADAQSRTFRVEVEIPNPDYTLPAGVTAELRVRGKERMAYAVNASVLTLNDEGDVGVKRLDEQGQVIFEPVEIIEEDRNQLWVAVEPSQMRLITTGAAYVSNGQSIPEEAVSEQ